MCDYNAVRNWLIATMVGLGGAVSSVILGIAYPLIAIACFWAAVGWCALTIGFAFAASLALNAFCTCAADNAACASPCSAMRSLMSALLGSVFFGGLLAVWAATHAWSSWIGALFLVAAAIALGTAAALMIWLIGSLGSCIARSAPPPASAPSPLQQPTGSGAAPI